MNKKFYIVGILLLGIAIGFTYIMSSDVDVDANPSTQTTDSGLRIN